MNILSEYQTIEKIKEGYSLCRYGDGEFFNIICREKAIRNMQMFDSKLKEKLIEILKHPLKNLLIGIPNMAKPKPWVSKFKSEFFKYIDKFPLKKTIFVSAFFSRPSISGIASKFYFETIKSIWENKEIVLINFNENVKNHILFSSCKINFIQIPRRNCFSEYDSIYEACKRNYSSSSLFLISAGPTANALVYDITKDGHQAIDIGQIVFEYSKFFGQNNLEQWTSQNAFRK